MAVKKKSEKQVVATQFITVDAGKLSQGLKATFEGVAMVFESLGMQVDVGNPADVSNSADVSAQVDEAKTEPVAEPIAEPVADEAKAEVKGEPKVEPASVKEKAVEVKTDTSAAEAKAKKTEPEVPAPAENKTSTAAPSVSVDDITKIIVQKIKQNRKNNEKIGAILKSYGASKVGELPEDKYEAFLTDLSAI